MNYEKIIKDFADKKARKVCFCAVMVLLVLVVLCMVSDFHLKSYTWVASQGYIIICFGTIMQLMTILVVITLIKSTSIYPTGPPQLFRPALFGMRFSQHIGIDIKRKYGLLTDVISIIMSLIQYHTHTSACEHVHTHARTQ